MSKAKRAAGKKLIGAQASAAIWEGVDKWLEQNPRKSTTDFILEACMEKLDAEKIPYDRTAALFDGRRRVPQAVFDTRPFVLNEPASLAKPVADGLTALVDAAPAAVASGAGSPKQSPPVPRKARAARPPATPRS